MKFIDDFVGYCRDFTGCPEIFLRWSALLALSAVAGDKHVHRRGDWDIRPNLWVLLIGNSSSYKSTGLNASRRLLAEASPGILASQEYSHEALLEDLAVNPHRAFYYDEAHSFFSMLESSYNKGKMKSAFMSLYNRIPLERKIKGKQGIGETHSISGAYVSWGGASTPFQLAETLEGKTTDLLSGLLPRFVIVPYFGSESCVEDPPPADTIKRSALVQRLKDLSLCGERSYTYNPEALKAKHSWLSQFNQRAQESGDSLTAAFFRKMRDEHFHKISMLSAFERGSSVMSVEDIAESAGLLWIVEKEWPKLIERLTEKEWDRSANRIEEFIQKEQEVDRQDILRSIRGIKAQKLTAILQGLEQDRKIMLREEPTTGRPRQVITWQVSLLPGSMEGSKAILNGV